MLLTTFHLLLFSVFFHIFSLKVPSGSSVEISSEGYDFLATVFEKYDADGDQALNPQELVNLFSTCPVMPWGPDVYNTVVTSERGWLNLPGYLALWSLNTLLDTQKTLEYLAYLGTEMTQPLDRTLNISLFKTSHT